jgi:hypothetical protein
MSSLHIRTLIAAAILLAVGLELMFGLHEIAAGVVVLLVALVAFLFPWIDLAEVGWWKAKIKSSKRSFEVDQLDLKDRKAPSLERESGRDGVNEDEFEDDDEDDDEDELQ